MQIIILPGMDGTGRLLAPFMQAMAKFHPTSTITYNTDDCRYADIAEYVSQRLPISGDYVIVAESFSGPVAIELAAQHPANLRGVAFVATFARSPRRFPRASVDLLELTPTVPRVMARLSRPLVMGKSRSKWLKETYRDVLRALPRRTVICRLREVLNIDVRDKLDLLQVPCVYLEANQDRLIPKRAAMDFKPHCQKYIAIDGPHFLLQAQPIIAAEQISNFIRELV